ncbi:MAG: ADP-ribosyl-[dinitrogen reductase] hydrolase [Rhodospirillaceae bacterium]
MERALGAYLGLAVGDALGATVEFMTRGEIKAKYGSHNRMIGGGWLNLKPGQVTDDTEMALCLGRVLIAHNGWDVVDACEGFARWLRGHPVDVGNTCRRGIRRYITQHSVEGPVNDGDAGNGAAMRSLPVTLATHGDPEAFEAWTLSQCHITHNNSLSDDATLALGRMVHALFDGGGSEACRAESERLITRHRSFGCKTYKGLSTAYIVDTVQTVLHFFFSTASFRDCLTETVNQGGDADTTGALAGMLAGAAYGVRAIPPEWLDRLDPVVAMEIRDQVPALLAIGGGGGQARRATT